MEGARPTSPVDQLELSEVEGPLDEQTPLNGAAQVIPVPAEEPSPAQAKQKSPWSTCNRTLFGKCKLWMAIISIFIGLILWIIISLCLMTANYIDEDENEILELSSNKTFLVTLKIPEECVTEEELPHLLKERLIDVYSSSPSLSRYFTSVEMDSRGENATITYHLQFGVPAEDDNFMKYMMSEELVLGILLQGFHDQNLSGCATLGLDSESLSLFGFSPVNSQLVDKGANKAKPAFCEREDDDIQEVQTVNLMCTFWGKPMSWLLAEEPGMKW